MTQQELRQIDYKEAAMCVCVSCIYYGACVSFKDKHMVSESGLSHQRCIEAFREKLRSQITGGIQEGEIGSRSGKPKT